IVSSNATSLAGVLFNFATGMFEPWQWELTLDNIPSQFILTNITGALVSTEYTSNTITVTGMDDGATAEVSVAGGTYSKNGGTYTADAGVAENGDTFSVRITTSETAGSSNISTLTIGGISDTFVVTTAGGSNTFLSHILNSQVATVLDTVLSTAQKIIRENR